MFLLQPNNMPPACPATPSILPISLSHIQHTSFFYVAPQGEVSALARELERERGAARAARDTANQAVAALHAAERAHLQEVERMESQLRAAMVQRWQTDVSDPAAAAAAAAVRAPWGAQHWAPPADVAAAGLQQLGASFATAASLTQSERVRMLGLGGESGPIGSVPVPPASWPPLHPTLAAAAAGAAQQPPVPQLHQQQATHQCQQQQYMQQQLQQLHMEQQAYLWQQQVQQQHEQLLHQQYQQHQQQQQQQQAYEYQQLQQAHQAQQVPHSYAAGSPAVTPARSVSSPHTGAHPGTGPPQQQAAAPVARPAMPGQGSVCEQGRAAEDGDMLPEVAALLSLYKQL